MGKESNYLSYCFMPDISGADNAETTIEKSIQGGDFYGKNFFVSNIVDRGNSCYKGILHYKSCI